MGRCHSGMTLKQPEGQGTRPVRQRVVLLASKVKGNPYVPLLGQGLSELGLRPLITETLSLGSMWCQRRQVDVLHVHWLELFFVYPDWVRSLKRWLSVMLALSLARVWGIRIVYTVHNIWQHEGQHRGLVWLANRWILSLAHGVHVHDQETAAELLRWRPRGRTWVIPHGSYLSAYAHGCTRQEARQQLSIDCDRFVYLFLGQVRPYKGIEDLVTVFRRQEDPDVLLLIAGAVHDAACAATVRALAEGDPRIRLHLAYVPDEELQLYFGACDVCVLPYRHVTTSGAALLALSFYVPVVAPRRGCFRQLVGEEGCGILYPPDEPDGLSEALALARHADLLAMRRACERLVDGLDWAQIARQHAAMYQALD